MNRLILALTLCLPLLGADSWEVVKGLRPGDKVKVEDASGKEHKGSVSAVSDEAISLGTVSVERAKVKRVQLHSSSRRARNIAIGAGIGVAIGVTVDQTLGVRLRNEGNSTGRAAMYLVPIGLFGGLGAAISPYRTVYHVK